MKINRNVGILSLLIVILVAQVTMMFHDVHLLQGNARVVNYAGIVRGATQRLIKNEMYGHRDNAEITRLDEIIDGLQHGGGNHQLTVIEDEDYQAKLSKLSEEWWKVKSDIKAYRADKRNVEELYQKSESYFVIANSTVAAAERFSDGVAQKIKTLEITIALNLIVIMSMLALQIWRELATNRRLSQIAYVDANTGLPNKRACEERLTSNTLIPDDDNVCCIMFDLNNLKITNDRYGHDVGDALIKSFATLARTNMPQGMFIGRLGGDEFVGIQHHADKAEVLKCLEGLQRDAGLTRVNNKENGIVISFAFGMAFAEENDGCTVKMLMNMADKNMYENKKLVKSMREASKKCV